MASIDVPLTKRGFGKTARKDMWWLQPLLVFLGYLSFIVYATWAGLQGDHYLCTTACGGADYLSPMYSPLLLPPVRTGGRRFVPFSAAMLILWAPGGFRFTCYYYRGAYYKAFWADPPSCAVGEPRSSYWGEKKFPLIMQNIHRYFLYLAILFVFILLRMTACERCSSRRPTARSTSGSASGSLVLIANPILLGLYTFGCHSFRHLVGGRKTFCRIARAQERLRLRVLPEPAPHAVGLDQHVLRRIRRFVCAPVRHGNLARLENLLNGGVSRRTNSTCWWWARAARVCARRSKLPPRE